MSKDHHGGTDWEYLAAVLQGRLGSRVQNLRVRVEKGGVILQGQAITYYVKQLAQHAAMEETNLPIHANEIEVRQDMVRMRDRLDES